MYLRTTQRKNKDGSVVTYYQLAHNLWDAEKKQSVARVIHNFGHADSVDRGQFVRLCKSLARVCQVQVSDLLPLSEALTDETVLPDSE